MQMGADGGYGTNEFAEGCRGLKITLHVAVRLNDSKIDGRTLSSDGYITSQRKRKRVEECFGWMRAFGLMHKLRHRGLKKLIGSSVLQRRRTTLLD